MPKTIALFNHKGGVSKTTTAFNLGWMLAEKGKKVVMVDTDPQCNLSGLVLGYKSDGGFEDYYQRNPEQNIYGSLRPAFESQPRPIEATECVEMSTRPGLFLLPGHVSLSEYEVTLGIAQELSASIPALKNLPGAIYHLISIVAEKYSADYVLIDMSPSLGAINQNILMTSDYFIVPASPDFFNLMAIDSLCRIIPKWASWAKRAHALDDFQKAVYPFPTPSLKFLGTIIQKYRPRSGRATIGFQSWIDQINAKVRDSLFDELTKNNLALSRSSYSSTNFCLSEIPDFNTLIATSQDHRTPVFALSDEMLGHKGNVLEQDRQKRIEFKNIFSRLADDVIRLTSI